MELKYVRLVFLIMFSNQEFVIQITVLHIKDLLAKLVRQVIHFNKENAQVVTVKLVLLQVDHINASSVLIFKQAPAMEYQQS